MTQVKVYDIDKEAVFEQSIVTIKNCFFIFFAKSSAFFYMSLFKRARYKGLFPRQSRGNKPLLH